jgi:DNA-binding protein H-NS
MQNFPFIPQNTEQNKSVQDRRDAQINLPKQGLSGRFIGVRLVEMFSPEWRERFGPMKTVRVLRHRIGVAGNKMEIECQIRDGFEYFDYDSQTGNHIAWFYDDDQGYNRKLLATHFFNGYLEIMEEDIRKEIEVIAQKMKAEAEINPEVAAEEKPLGDSEISKMGIQGIDEQIKYLKEQKAKIQSAKKAEADSVPTMEPDVQPVAPETVKLRRGRKQKSALIQ